MPNESKTSSIKAGSASLRSDQRVFTCGKTGSGKTYLMRHLTARLNRLVVLDGKGTLSQEAGWQLDPWDREARRLLKAGEPVRARVTWDIARDPDEFWSEVLSACYSAGDVTIYIDEVYSVVEPQSKPPNILTACYTRGRELGVGMWAATQRPKNVPMVVMSEAEHFFCFRLLLEDDRSRMAEFMGDTVLTPISDEHGFYYMRPEWDEPKYVPQFTTKGG